MGDGVTPTGGSHRFEPPGKEDSLHPQADTVKPIKGKGSRQPPSAALKQRTATHSTDWYLLRHQELLTQKNTLSCQKVFSDSLEEVRSIMDGHKHQSQHFKISYLDDSGRKITVIPPDPALIANPERLQELMNELDLELKPLEKQLKPQRATIHKRLHDVEQALNTSKIQLQSQGLKIPHDPGAPDAFFLGKELLDIPEPVLLYPKPRQPENHAHPRARKAPQNKTPRPHGNQADNTRRQARPGMPPLSPFQKEAGFEFNTRPANRYRANNPNPGRNHSKPPQNAKTRAGAKVEPDYGVKPSSKSRKHNPEVNDSLTVGGNFPPPPPPAPPLPAGWTKTKPGKTRGAEKYVPMTQPIPYQQGSGDTQKIAERIKAIRELHTGTRETCNRSDQQELEMTRQWLEFYRTGNARIQNQQWSLNDIMSMRDEELEKNHDFIQLLFPRPSPSAYNREAPLITTQMIEGINKNPEIQQAIKRSLHKMLGFWGIQWQEATNEFSTASDDHPGLIKWCGDFDHNHQRITRLFEFLVAVGWIEMAQTLESFMNNYRKEIHNKPQEYWKAVIDLTQPDRPKVKPPAPPPAPPVIKPTVPLKPKASQVSSAKPADRYEARGSNTAKLYARRKPFPQSATLERWQTPGGAGTAAWQIHNDPDFKPEEHKVAVVIAGNSGLPLGGLADSNGLNGPVTPEKLKLKTQEETVTANCILTTCGENRARQDQWVANTVRGRWGLKQPVYESTDTKTIQGIDYTKSTDPNDYADAWVVRNALLSAVTGQQLVPGTTVKADLIFSAGPNAGTSGNPTGSMKRTQNKASMEDFQHFRKCVKCTVRAALDGAANAENTHVLLAPISCGVYAGVHKNKMTDEAFDAIVNEVLNERVGPGGKKRRAYFVKVIVSGITSNKNEHPVKSYQKYMQQHATTFKGKDPSTHVEFYEKNDPYYEFTNFWVTEKPVVIDGDPWRTTEHYFQACKFKKQSMEWKNIQQQNTVRMTYKEGKTGNLVTRNFDLKHPRHVFDYVRTIVGCQPQSMQLTNNQWNIISGKESLQYTSTEWDKIKDQVMLKALRAKAQQSSRFRKLLIQSDQALIVEVSEVDGTWGIGKDHQGQNRLGAMLMQVRDELKAGLLPETETKTKT